MAGNAPPQAATQVAGAEQAARHYVPAPPTSRELRAQAVHRLQVGLFGLCAMLLLVGLANILMDRARLSDADDTVKKAVAADAKAPDSASDPLSALGVLPSADPTPSASPAATGSGAADLDPAVQP